MIQRNFPDIPPQREEKGGMALHSLALCMILRVPQVPLHTFTLISPLFIYANLRT